ncbi:MAG TPA: formyltransferase family protein [Rugosimonospora sp.]|nr:formyltransferase family protein [Rugosimonospora sp.]
MTPLRIALIRGDEDHHRYLESLLTRRFDLALAVVEPRREQGAALRRRGRYRDWVYHHYHGYRRALTGRNRYRRRYFAHAPQLWAAPGTRRLRVASVNDGAVVDALRAAAVDVVVVVGCSQLTRDTLTAAGPLVLGLHGGLLPYYRGSHCVFFAVYDGRLDRVGATIHRVDLGLDTGELIEAVRTPVHGDEPPERLTCRADLLAIHRLAGWLEILERGGELPSCPQPAVGRTYRTSDRGPTHDLRYLLRRYARAVRPASSARSNPQSSGR